MKVHRLLPIIAAALFLASVSHAQTGQVYRIGFLSPRDFAPGTNPGRLTEEISRQLAQSGFTTGANLELIKRGAEGHFERLPALVAAAKRPVDRSKSTRCEDGSLSCSWAKFSAIVKNAFASSSKTKP